MTAIVQQDPVTAPVRQSPPGSILDCATVIDVDSLWGAMSEGMWDSAGCGNNVIIPNALCTDEGYVTPEKDFEGPVWSTGHTFAIYRSLSCLNIGFDLQLADLESAFNASEGRAVARAIWDIYDPIADAVPGTGGEAMCNFGLLAEYALDTYGGQPTFLLPASMAIALQSDRVFNPAAGGGYTTAVGGCVAIGAGLTSALALGIVVIWRSAPIVVQVFNPVTNERKMLCERAYRVAVDCDFAAKVPNTINCGALP